MVRMATTMRLVPKLRFSSSWAARTTTTLLLGAAVAGATSSVAAFAPAPTAIRSSNRLLLPWRRHHACGSAQQRASSMRSTTSSSTRLFASSSSSNSNSQQKKKVPVTLLAGFLGSGKTSTLQHLLENKENLRIGVIVNDMASVNIDRKLVVAAANNNNNNSDNNEDNQIIELQNGCACCSLQDELLFSVEKLVTARDTTLDAIVVELSGVADPAAVRYHWQQELPKNGNLAAAVERTPRIVTLLDALTFGTDYFTWDTAQERWSSNSSSSSSMVAAAAPADDCTGNRKVVELLAEQCEAADLLLVNKVDLLLQKNNDNDNNKALQVPCAMARALNPKAELVTVEFGRLAPRELLGMLDPSEETNTVQDDSSCADPDCTDTSHSHSHSHADHNDNPTTAVVAADCTDPDCTDHSHSHSHDHATTRTDQLGISSFVYRATRPFHSGRLMKVLNRWPVPIKDTLDVGVWQDPSSAFVVQSGDDDGSNDSPFVGVLRSKGFCWFAPQKWSGGGNDAWRHETAMYW